jgi:hypothetical protein
MRRTLALAVTAIVAAGAVSAPAPASPRAQTFSTTGLASGPRTFRDTILSGSRRLQAAIRANRWGGATTAADGETVDVYVSDAYPVDPTVTQSLADFVVQLYHGSELADATFFVAPLDELREICGASAGGCYDPESETIVVPGENLPDADGTTKETVLVHEYGHHVAKNRSNAPWTAENWGPKRWASAVGVCARQAESTAFPGDEASNYPLNPGEAWAETFRLLNFDKQTWPNWTALAPWNVDQSFYPGAGALQAAEADVLDPWTGPTVATWTGRVAAVKRSARRPIGTPLDGWMSIKLTQAPKGSQVSIVDPSTNTVVATGLRRASFKVCGQRSLVLSVSSKATGAFSAVYATP